MGTEAYDYLFKVILSLGRGGLAGQRARRRNPSFAIQLDPSSQPRSNTAAHRARSSGYMHTTGQLAQAGQQRALGMMPSRAAQRSVGSMHQN